MGELCKFGLWYSAAPQNNYEPRKYASSNPALYWRTDDTPYNVDITLLDYTCFVFAVFVWPSTQDAANSQLHPRTGWHPPEYLADAWFVIGCWQAYWSPIRQTSRCDCSPVAFVLKSRLVFPFRYISLPWPIVYELWYFHSRLIRSEFRQCAV